MFGSLLLSQSPILTDQYETVASAINNGLGLSLRHMRNIDVALTGKLEFQDSAGVV